MYGNAGGALPPTRLGDQEDMRDPLPRLHTATNRTGRLVRRSASLVAVLALMGACSLFVDDRASDPNTIQGRAERATAAAAAAPFPNLAEVPDRPPPVTVPSVRRRITEGLAADRSNARYTAEAIRLQGQTGRTAPVQTEAPAEAAAPAGEAIAAPQVAAAPIAEPVRRLTPAMVKVAAAEPAEPASEADGASPVTVDMTAVAASATPVALPAQLQLATIIFAHGSYGLDQRDMEVLRQVARVQRQYGGNLVVVGHSSGRTLQIDPLQHRIVNFQLSLHRANAVALALTRFGVSPENVLVEARGALQPIYLESMATGEAGNRRAEVYLVR